MVAVRVGAAAIVGAMVAVIGGAFAQASFTTEGAALLELTWGRVTLVDIYLAFLVGWAWIAVRERHVGRAAAWLVAVAVTGSLALGVYALGAAVRATSLERFLLGPHR